MQPDMGGLWRQEVLRRIHDAQLAETLARPTPPAERPSRVVSRWRAVAGWLRGGLRRRSSPAAPGETSEIRPEIGDATGGPWHEVMRACEQALAERPDLVALWVGLSLAAARVGDLELAEGTYEMARVLCADEADAWRDTFQHAFPEINLTEAVEAEIVMPDKLATSGNGR